MIIVIDCRPPFFYFKIKYTTQLTWKKEKTETTQMLKVSTWSNKTTHTHTNKETSGASEAEFSHLKTRTQPDNKHMAPAKMRPIKRDYPTMISVDVLNN